MEKYNGIVIALKANYLIVEIEYKQIISKIDLTNDVKQPIRILCTRRKKLDHSGAFISVGDYVIVEAINWESLRGIISARKTRLSWLKRPSVANVTDIFVFISVEEPSFDPDQTSRFLLTAEKTELNITLVLTKIDLVSQNQSILFKQRLTKWGYNVLPISVKKHIGVDLLINKLNNSKLSVLCGPSGVGKTSFINYLFDNISLPVKSVSRKIKRGKNTTRHVELFSLDNGSLVADTPGFNRPEINSSPSDFALLFPEIRSQLTLNSCKFRNCLHRDEPGCLIDKNLDRYSFYRQQIDEMLNLHHQDQED